MQLESQYISVFLVGSILCFIDNILQAWCISLKLCQLRKWSEQAAAHLALLPPLSLFPAYLDYIWLYSENWNKIKCCLYVWTSAGFITKAGLKMNWSNFVDDLVINRNHFLWECACKVVQRSCCPSSNKLCWIYGNINLCHPVFQSGECNTTTFTTTYITLTSDVADGHCHVRLKY